MEKYRINTDFKHFKKDQVVDKDCLISALELPFEASHNDTLFALAMAEVISFVLPERLGKIIEVAGESTLHGIKSSFSNTYSLIDERDMLYSCDTEGIPDATMDELLDLGYLPMYSERKQGRPYIEFGEARYYAGDSIIKFVQLNETMFEATVIKLTDEFFSTIDPAAQYFPDEKSMIKHFTELNSTCLCAGLKGDIILPIDEKRFSVNDIRKLAGGCDAYNGSAFAQKFANSIVEAAIIEII